jgi:hypothetical protein
MPFSWQRIALSWDISASRGVNWVASDSVTSPRRFHCQPDLALVQLEQQPDWETLSVAEKAGLKNLERARIRPAFHSLRYGLPTYCQLAHSCSPDIKRGADDQSEMGVFHDLYEPQRFTNLDARLDEYTPAGSDAGIILAT